MLHRKGEVLLDEGMVRTDKSVVLIRKTSTPSCLRQFVTQRSALGKRSSEMSLREGRALLRLSGAPAIPNELGRKILQ